MNKLLLLGLLALLMYSNAFAESEWKRESSELGIPHNSTLWSYPQTPFFERIGLSAGDGLGGPIRFNTRFPETKGDPHPASYYHTQAFLSLELEFAAKTGAILIGAIHRRDFAHKGISSRAAVQSNQLWIVDDFSFQDNGLLLAWVFGDRMREFFWNADLGLLYDRAVIDATLRPNGDISTSKIHVLLHSLSTRSRIHFGTVSSSSIQLSAGPEVYIPLWSMVSDQSDSNVKDFAADQLKLSNSSGLGLSGMVSYRF